VRYLIVGSSGVPADGRASQIIAWVKADYTASTVGSWRVYNRTSSSSS
jgi:hypothetical protein